MYDTRQCTLIDHVGNLTELMGDLDGAVYAYEQALRHNQYSIQAMNAISCILRTKENFPRAVEYLQGILKLDPNNGEVWGSLGKLFQCPSESLSELTHSQGHCFLMMEDLQQAYSAYQQALYHLRDPKVGILELIRSSKANRCTSRSRNFGMA